VRTEQSFACFGASPPGHSCFKQPRRAVLDWRPLGGGGYVWHTLVRFHCLVRLGAEYIYLKLPTWGAPIAGGVRLGVAVALPARPCHMLRGARPKPNRVSHCPLTSRVITLSVRGAANKLPTSSNKAKLRWCAPRPADPKRRSRSGNWGPGSFFGEKALLSKRTSRRGRASAHGSGCSGYGQETCSPRSSAALAPLRDAPGTSPQTGAPVDLWKDPAPKRASCSKRKFLCDPHGANPPAFAKKPTATSLRRSVAPLSSLANEFFLCPSNDGQTLDGVITITDLLSRPSREGHRGKLWPGIS